MDKTKIAVDAFDTYAEQYQEKYMNIKKYHPGLDTFCESILLKNARILELGCGPGNITKYLIEKRSDFNILASDLSKNMLRIAKSNNPSVQFKEINIKEIHLINQTFNGIVCGFCFPYLSESEVDQFIQESSNKLNKNGVLYISTMEGDEEKSSWEGPSSGRGHKVYINYHRSEKLIQSLKENQFELIEMHRVITPNPDADEVVDLIIIAKKC